MGSLYSLSIASVFAFLSLTTAIWSEASLSTQPATAFRRGEVTFADKLHNVTSLPIQEVQLEAFLGKHAAQSALRDLLEPGNSVSVTLPLGPAPDVPGVYSVVTRTTYRDQNGAPFTAMKTVPLVTDMRNSEGDLLTARCQDTPLRRRRGALRVHIQSHAKWPLDVRATWYAPQNLSCKQAVQSVTIAPEQEICIQFDCSAIGESSARMHPVVIVLDTILENQHLSYPVTATVYSPSPAARIRTIRHTGLVVIVALLTATVLASRRGIRPPPERLTKLLDYAILALLAGFTLYHLSPHLLFVNTVTTGGDTPAHNYLAAHLAKQFFGHGRIISWANGWWCGFPMFQYYFPLPYLCMALLDLILPFNIAFKLVSVSGILLLPPCTYLAARRLRSPDPIPIVAAILTIPMLFDTYHTMWGVNINSTLAGMIANSLSFPLMLLVISAAFGDADSGRFRLRTPLLIALLLGSHFFTSLMGCLIVAAIPFMRPRAGIRRAFLVLLIEGLLGIILMAWWLVPLFLKSPFTVEFGSNWTVHILKQIPPSLWIALPFALVALVATRKQRIPLVPLSVAMLLGSLLLFFFGYDVSAVFVNVRLWPFIVFSSLMLGATGISVLARFVPFRAFIPFAVLLATLLFGVEHPNAIRIWSKWNYEGLERKPFWDVIEQLVLPLDGTPGRLAYDLHETNNTLGSSRVFETVPFLIDKPILEGGILSSAHGSLYAYYIQGETSKCSAGFPNRVRPASFNLPAATRHLRLFNVKHFIARSPRTQAAMDESPHWTFLRACRGWRLYELNTHNGSHVRVPQAPLQAVATADWQGTGLQWIYTPQLLNRPFVLLPPELTTDFSHGIVSSEEQFNALVSTVRNEPIPSGPPQAAEHPDVVISNEELTESAIRFHTSHPGLPHIIACSYFPNWKARDGSDLYMVTPGFMVVYPKSGTVEIIYQRTTTDRAAIAISVSGLALLMGLSVFLAALRFRHTAPTPPNAKNA